MSEYLLETFPAAITMYRVPLGGIPSVITMDFGPVLGAKVYRPSRPVCDAIVIQDRVLHLIEGKIWNINHAIGQVLYYSRLIDDTPEIAQYKDLPRMIHVVSARAPPLSSSVHLFPEIDFVQFLKPWVAEYLQHLESYWSHDVRASRQKRKEALIALGYDKPAGMG